MAKMIGEFNDEMRIARQTCNALNKLSVGGRKRVVSYLMGRYITAPELDTIVAEESAPKKKIKVKKGKK
jgi:hypothetical protein